jgi:FkbM family methyltransferase
MIEEKTINLAKNGEGKVAIDIGANVGSLTRIMNDRFKRVIAVEPHPNNIAELKSLKLKNVEIREGVIGSHDGKKKLFECHGNPGGHSICEYMVKQSKWGHDIDRHFEVDSWRLDTLTEGMDVSVIKIDVEAAEEEVLRSGKQMLERCHPDIALETHATINCESIYRFLNELGYKIYWSGDESQPVHTIEINKHYRCVVP